jgi:Flp pilus assembly protein TadD
LYPLDLALDLVCQGRLNESLAHFHSALELNPHDSTTRIAYADALAKLERLPEMLACLDGFSKVL